MSSNDSLRMAEMAEGTDATGKGGISEPPTGRALWPTFMRRTLDEEEVRKAQPLARPPRKGG